MGASSIEDPKRRLETTVAYLRLGCREGGIALGVKGGHAMTPQLQALVERGDMSILRASRSTRRLVHRVMTSPAGKERLADLDRRYGEDFGAPAVIPTLRNDRPRR